MIELWTLKHLISNGVKKTKTIICKHVLYWFPVTSRSQFWFVNLYLQGGHYSIYNYVYIYVCIYIYMCNIYICIYIDMCNIYMYICTYNMYIYIYMYTAVWIAIAPLWLLIPPFLTGSMVSVPQFVLLDSLSESPCFVGQLYIFGLVQYSQIPCVHRWRCGKITVFAGKVFHYGNI